MFSQGITWESSSPEIKTSRQRLPKLRMVMMFSIFPPPLRMIVIFIRDFKVNKKNSMKGSPLEPPFIEFD